MKEPQILIDSKILQMFISGTDQDRQVIRKMYPMLDLSALENELLVRIFKDHSDKIYRTYPVMFHGRMKKFAVTILEDEQN